MDKKYIIIAVIILAVVVIGGYFLLNNQATSTVSTIDNNTTFLLSKSAYMVIPKDTNASKKADKKGIFYYKDNKDNLNITICSNLSTSEGAKVIKNLKNNISVGAKKIIEGNAIIYEKGGIYSIFVKNTQYNDTFILQSLDKNLLLACWKTVKYHDPAIEIKFNDTGSSSSGSSNVVSAVEQTETAVQSSYSSSSSSSASSSSSSDSYYDTFGYSSSSSGGGSSSSSGGGGYDLSFTEF